MINKIMDYDCKIRQIEFTKKIIAKYYDLDADLCFNTKRRDRELITAKHVAIYFVNKNIKITSVELGKVFGCGHATILHAIKKVDNLKTYDKELRNQIDEIDRLLTYKSKTKDARIDLNKEFYFIDLDNFVSIKQSDKRAIILSGFTEEEINNMTFLDARNGNWFNGKKKIIEHSNTEMYILKEKDEN
jgi:hypothetical protein